MSNAAVVAGIRQGMASALEFGVSKTISVIQAQGTYDTYLGKSLTADLSTDVTALLADKEGDVDDSNTSFEKKSVIILIDDLPNLTESDQFDLRDGGAFWRKSAVKVDPTDSFYELELRR